LHKPLYNSYTSVVCEFTKLDGISFNTPRCIFYFLRHKLFILFSYAVIMRINNTPFGYTTFVPLSLLSPALTKIAHTGNCAVVPPEYNFPLHPSVIVTQMPDSAACAHETKQCAFPPFLSPFRLVFLFLVLNVFCVLLPIRPFVSGFDTHTAVSPFSNHQVLTLVQPVLFFYSYILAAAFLLLVVKLRFPSIT